MNRQKQLRELFRVREDILSHKSDSAQCYSAQSNLFREYLCENEYVSKTILISTCLSGTQMGWIHRIKNAKNYRDTVTLKGP